MVGPKATDCFTVISVSGGASFAFDVGKLLL
jgi:hypothetical protein